MEHLGLQGPTQSSCVPLLPLLKTSVLSLALWRLQDRNQEKQKIVWRVTQDSDDCGYNAERPWVAWWS